MNVLIVGLLLWPFICLAMFCLACWRLMNWDFKGWGQAFKHAWLDRYTFDVILPILAMLPIAIIISLGLWAVGLIPF